MTETLSAMEYKADSGTFKSSYPLLALNPSTSLFAFKPLPMRKWVRPYCKNYCLLFYTQILSDPLRGQRLGEAAM